LAALLALGRAFAIDAEPGLHDAGAQARYEQLTHELRCLQCQNNTIADSEASIAADLRHQVRELILAGKSDAEIRAFLTQRYGDFVLYKPPLTTRTYLLWAAPLLLLAIGVGTVAFVVVRRARRPFDLEDEGPA
jgi:cytochrome c-type biogenesis protein CcmH